MSKPSGSCGRGFFALQVFGFALARFGNRSQADGVVDVMYTAAGGNLMQAARVGCEVTAQ